MRFMQWLLPDSGGKVWNHDRSWAGEEALPLPEPSGQDDERHDAPCSVQLSPEQKASYGFWVQATRIAGVGG